MKSLTFYKNIQIYWIFHWTMLSENADIYYMYLYFIIPLEKQSFIDPIHKKYTIWK